MSRKKEIGTSKRCQRCACWIYNDLYSPRCKGFQCEGQPDMYFYCSMYTPDIDSYQQELFNAIENVSKMFVMINRGCSKISMAMSDFAETISYMARYAADRIENASSQIYESASPEIRFPTIKPMPTMEELFSALEEAANSSEPPAGRRYSPAEYGDKRKYRKIKFQLRLIVRTPYHRPRDRI